MGLEVGRIVSSKAGRDLGKYYLVINLLDENYVLVADGLTRTVSHPKKKNVKHLVGHKLVSEIASAIKEKKLTNQELRFILSSFDDIPEDREEVSSDNG